MTVFLETERDKGAAIEETVRKLTGNAARTLGLTDRGFVSSGMSADLLVLDWEHFSARENLADPGMAPQGWTMYW